MINIIAAIGENNELGYKNNLLCYLPRDLKHFKELTSGHTVIMGSKTWESLPKKPLPNRKNIVLTRKNIQIDGAEVVNTKDEIFEIIKKEEKDVFIIGGASLYELFLPYADKLYLTKIVSNFFADVWFPIIDYEKWEVSDIEFVSKDEKNEYDIYFKTLTKKR